MLETRTYMSLPSDRFIVSRAQTTATRMCPFCESLIRDVSGNDINFIVHLGTATPKHQLRQEWADYVSYVNRL